MRATGRATRPCGPSAAFFVALVSVAAICAYRYERVLDAAPTALPD